ncbi:hypothetical protein BJF93_06880 [Xaviernesmea oryzae]|uniref:Cytochrome c domain-containing protein n=2 Tax=Xaviernesmea oryzae TaxID=464029 RepID=A0A1Q9ASD0_9HYPH|nr:hypothetical protein BJF93_06880 [Xaviernesmea oryzae]SEL41907.1 Cytochrome c553 [Xaviernesmea oryzae]
MDKRWPLMLAGSAAALAVVGLGAIWLGAIDVRASTGHWKITEWVLHGVMRASVKAAAGEAPQPLDPDLVAMGAGHFEQACLFCHGAPDTPRSALARAMLPPPPDLKEVVATWRDQDLFEIVQHGVRYSGMPAWPAKGRKDEVWAMVAFLRAYPDMTGDAYRRMATAPEVAGAVATGDRQPKADVLARCDACHAADKLADGSFVPQIQGQNQAYLAASLRAFLSGERESGMMRVAVNGLAPEELDQLAAHYATLARAPSPGPDRPAPTLSEAGRMLAERGDASRDIPACNSCHGAGSGNPLFPRLDGLSQATIATRLHLFQDKEAQPGGTPYRELMRKAARKLEERDIKALSAYYGSGQ